MVYYSSGQQQEHHIKQDSYSAEPRIMHPTNQWPSSLTKDKVSQSCVLWTSINHLEAAHGEVHHSHSKVATLVLYSSLLGNGPGLCRARISEQPLTFMGLGIYKYFSGSPLPENLYFAGYGDPHILPAEQQAGDFHKFETCLAYTVGPCLIPRRQWECLCMCV